MAEGKWMVCCLFVLCPLINFGLTSIFSAAPFQYVTTQMKWRLSQMDIDVVYPSVIILHIIVIIVVWIFVCCCLLRLQALDDDVDQTDHVVQFELDDDLVLPDSPGIQDNTDIPPVYSEALNLSTASGPPTYDQMLLTRQESFLNAARNAGHTRNSTAPPMSPTSQISFNTILEDSVFEEEDSNEQRKSTQRDRIVQEISGNSAEIDQRALSGAVLEPVIVEEAGHVGRSTAIHANSSGDVVESERDTSENNAHLWHRQASNSSTVRFSGGHVEELNGVSETGNDVTRPENGASSSIELRALNSNQPERLNSVTSTSNNEQNTNLSRSRLTGSSSNTQRHLLSLWFSNIRIRVGRCCTFITCDCNVRVLAGGCALVLFILQFFTTTGLLFVLSAICGAGKNCAQDLITECSSEHWIKYKGHCYRFRNPAVKTFNQSLHQCESYSPSATLLYIMDEAEDDFIRDVILKLGGGLWLTGGHYKSSSSKLRWQFDKHDAQYSKDSREYLADYQTHIKTASNISRGDQCLAVGTIGAARATYAWYRTECYGDYNNTVCKEAVDCGLACYVVSALIGAVLILSVGLPCIGYCGKCLLSRAG